ncbi:hypothetical protein [Conexivisphaera calida]|uniref:Uncharacterized protein n=1 Tax=Conexivisphaera calida TaxID=1874277 RepID=A0A4P2VPI7_9ARCH|nr:hypothetical protein [Conexivisphaera calida]BBE42795.1 hypothetical protein NAS2_1408 [Conexivisphaera calida]
MSILILENHGIKDPRWRGMWLIAYEDDSSRFIVGYGVHRRSRPGTRWRC